jgi:spore maturation protein A
LRPVAKRLLRTDNEDVLTAASMNLSVNMLGISGAATPYGVRTAQLLDKTENAEFSSAMFFVLNATSLQILPSSLVAVRVAMGSNAPTDIILPTLLTSAFSTLIGVAMVFTFIRPKKTATSPHAIQKLKEKNVKRRGQVRDE